jgi:hypothetical protein
MGSAPSDFSRVLPDARRVEWIVGVPGGIPTDRPVWKHLTEGPYGADPTGVRDSSAAFAKALADLPEHHVLFVPPGTYRLDRSLRWPHGANHRTLRGAGLEATRLVFYAGLIEMGSGSPEGRSGLDVNARPNGLTIDIDLSQDAVKGETHVHLAALPDWVKPGHLYLIDQLDDPSFVANGGQEGSGHPREATGNGPRGLGQIVLVTSAEERGPGDYQVSFEIPLYYGFQVAQQAQLAMAGYDTTTEVPLTDCGVEDLYLEAKHSVGWGRGVPGHFFRMDNCVRCWVKGLEAYNVPANCHVWASFCYRLEIRDSFFHDSHGYAGGEAYGIALYNATCASLVENNAFHHLHCPLMACYGAAGNVFGYNYIFEGSANARQFPSLSSHATHAYMNLWEGNHGTKALFDWTHGSASHNLVFRNRLVGYEPGNTWDQSAVNIAYYNRSCSLLGNVLGMPGYRADYEHSNGGPDNPGRDAVIYRLGYSLDKALDYAYDDLETMDLLRHGNWDAVTQAVQWDPAIADRALPASLYLTAKPAWFGDLPWPAFGPDTAELEGRIPAQVRFWRGRIPPYPAPPEE